MVGVFRQQVFRQSSSCRSSAGGIVETWQIVLYVVGALLLLTYFKRRSDRVGRGE